MAKILTIFKFRFPSGNYIMPNGKPLIVQNGEYLTDIPAEIQHLQNEIACGHPHIFQDADEEKRTISSDLLDPVAALREKFFKEFQEQQARAVDPKSNKGTSVQQPLIPASTTNIAAIAANGVAVDAKLIDLVATRTAEAISKGQ